MARLRICLFRDTLVSYGRAIALQESLRQSVKQGVVPGTVLCLQHNHVFTLGKRGSVDDISMSSEELATTGAEIHVVKRGGEVTYHGPGQCVIYPIIDVRKTGARAFVNALENSIIATLGAWGIASRSAGGQTAGVWAGSRKIAAVGVQFSQGVSTHGAALNVDLDTQWFNKIVPCGDPDTTVTTMSEVLKRPVDVATVQQQVAHQFLLEHGVRNCEFISPEEIFQECAKTVTSHKYGTAIQNRSSRLH